MLNNNFCPKILIRKIKSQINQNRHSIVIKRKKQKGHIKINYNLKNALYNWVIRHPQLVQSTISINNHRIYVGGHEKLQLVPKLI